jgi:tripartite-type tricarboxylate transporter receptor subunit TctC
MLRKTVILMVGIMGFILFAVVGQAAAPYYEGKTIRIIVGYSAGGGFDAYARIISRHMSKHILGKPTLIVENMTGAGSLISANYLYRVAKPDGLTIGHFDGGLFLSQLLEKPGIEFDARKFEYIGSPVKNDPVCVFFKASGITSIDKWMASKSPVKMGGVAPGSFTPDNVIRIVKAALGLPIQVVSGYKGTADIRLAVESGELAGSGWGWASIKATWRNALQVGDLIPVLQLVPKAFPDLPDIPLAISLAKTEEARQLIEVGIHACSAFARPFVLPPGTPKEFVQAVRQAFHETLKDREFVEEAEKAKLDLEPVTSDELEIMVAKTFKLDPGLLSKLNEVLYK